jgi:hypothetical protein
LKQPAFVRKQALSDLLRFSGISLTILGLAKLAGADVGVDPTSADFGKIKTGNTRSDSLGGLQQYIRLGAQLVMGEYTSSTTGRTYKLGQRVGGRKLTRLDLIERSIEAKEAPLTSLVTDMMRGTDQAGKELNIPKEVLNRYVPMVINDAIDIAKDDPSLLPLIVPGLHGWGLQTYGGETTPPITVHHADTPHVRRPK